VLNREASETSCFLNAFCRKREYPESEIKATLLMMNCFQVVKSVLDDTYAEIPGDDRDEQIKARLKKYRPEFRNLLRSQNICYEDPVSRFAYIYEYVSSHANMVRGAICLADELKELFKKERVTASCIGGGPGSDLVGILKYLSRRSEKPALTCYLLDRNKTWKECWCDLDGKLEINMRLSTSYMDLDVCEPDSYEPYSKYLKADLFTFVYFVSEVFAHMKRAQPFFDHLFANVRPGALMLFIDNNDSRFYKWFDQTAKSNNMEIVAQVNDRYVIPPDEQKDDLGEYYAKFGSPKLQANVVFRVVKKGAE
jgi:hypothetical protein